jgi:hypothetical protein
MISYYYCNCGKLIPEIFRWLCKKYHFIGLCSQMNNISDKDYNDHIYNLEIINKCHLFFPCGYRKIIHQMQNLYKIYKEIDRTPPFKWIGGIIGTDRIISKSGLWIHIMKHYVDRDEMETWLPKTYVLSSIRDKIEFFGRYHDSSNHNINRDSIKFILKKNIQRKEGIYIHQGIFTRDEWYKYNNDGYVVIQELMENVGRVYERKVNLRVYMLVTSRKGKVRVYYHQMGKCLYTKGKTGEQLGASRDIVGASRDIVGASRDIVGASRDIMEDYITSYNWDNNIEEMDHFYDENPHSWEDLKRYINKTYNSSGDIGRNMEKKVIKIIKRIKKIMRRVCITPEEWWKITQYQLFGLDFIFDEEWNPYLLEINKGPDMEYKCNKDVIIKRRVYEDIYRTMEIIPSLEESLYIEI